MQNFHPTLVYVPYNLSLEHPLLLHWSFHSALSWLFWLHICCFILLLSQFWCVASTLCCRHQQYSSLEKVNVQRDSHQGLTSCSITHDMLLNLFKFTSPRIMLSAELQFLFLLWLTNTVTSILVHGTYRVSEKLVPG